MKLKLEIQNGSNIDNIVLKEPVDMEILDKLLKCDLLLDKFNSPITDLHFESERQQLLKYKDQIKNGFAEIKYSRVKGLNFGRVYPSKSIGLFPMRKLIRNTLANKFFVDIDIENCHPSILSQICHKNDIECYYLDKYIKNRDTILNDVMNEYSIDRSKAKTLFIQLLYFGTFESWAKENNIKSKPSSFINKFKNELKDIGNIIYRNNEEILKIIDNKKKDLNINEFNKIGSVISYYLQEYECQILETIFKYCIDNKIIKNNICVLCADGLMIQKENYNENLLKNFNELIKKELKFNLNFIAKNMDENYFNILDSHILSDDLLEKELLFKELSNYDNVIIMNNKKDFEIDILTELFFEDLKNLGEEKFIEYFHLTKSFKYFNNYHAFFYLSCQIYKIFDHVVNAYTNFNLSFKHITFLYQKRVISFTDLYDKSKYKKMFSTFNFEPNKKEKNDKFNLFYGFKFDDENNEYDENIIKFYLDHIKFICNDNLDVYNYVLNWFSHIIQKPEKKTKVALIFFSQIEGVGKNIIFDIFEKIIDGYCIKFRDTSALTDKFNGEMMGKLFVVGDEINARAQDVANELKDIITRPDEIIEFKGKDKIYLNDYKNYAFTTNNENVFKVSNTDRRFMFNECPMEKKDEEYYEILFNALNDNIILKNIYNFFKMRDITNFSPSEIVMTEYKERLIIANLPAYIKFILDDYKNFSYEGCIPKDWTTEELYLCSINYAKEKKIQSTYTEKLFCNQFKKVFGEFNFLHPKTRRSMYRFPLDRKEEIEDIIKKNFILVTKKK